MSLLGKTSSFGNRIEEKFLPALSVICGPLVTPESAIPLERNGDIKAHVGVYVTGSTSFR